MSNDQKKPLNKRASDRLKRLSSSLENSNKHLAKLSQNDLSSLESLIARDQISPSSFPVSGTGSSIVASSSHSSPELTPVERAADLSMRQKNPGDPLRDELKRIEKKIFSIEDLSRQVNESIEAMNSTVEKKRGRQTTTPCSACQILPAVRTGFCENCFYEWLDAGSPDKTRWHLYKNETKNREGKILVTDMPPARHPVPGGHSDDNFR
jgi:hypothetical protein